MLSDTHSQLTTWTHSASAGHGARHIRAKPPMPLVRHGARVHRRNSKKSGGATIESRNVKTPSTTGAVSVTPCVWTRASRAPSGATPTINRDSGVCAAGSAGVIVMSAMPCWRACEVWAQVVLTPGSPPTPCAIMQRWASPGTSQYAPGDLSPGGLTRMRRASRRLAPKIGALKPRRVAAGSPSGGLRNRGNPRSRRRSTCVTTGYSLNPPGI